MSNMSNEMLAQGSTAATAHQASVQTPLVSTTADKTYNSILRDQLDITYQHMGQYLVMSCLLNEDPSLTAPQSDVPIVYHNNPEEAIKADFESIHALLDEMTEQTRSASVVFFVCGLL